MKKRINEKRVLKKLGIKDFRHLTKSHVLQLASMLDSMDPEVAKKALDQFPEFANTTKEILADYKDIIDKGLTSNEDSMKAVYTAYGSIMTSLQNELEKENLSFDEKKYIIDQMKEIAVAIAQKDSENKKWLSHVFELVAIFGTFVLVIISTTLGGRSNIRLPEGSSPEALED